MGNEIYEKIPILIRDYHAEIMLSSGNTMSQFVITRDTKLVYATLVPRSVRKTCAGEFFAPWDLSTPGGVLRSHGATRRRFFFPEQALSGFAILEKLGIKGL